LFAVAKDAHRPFQVQAGKATVTAVGTAFNVRRAVDRTVVAVIEGRVRVEPARAALPWLRDGGKPAQLQLDAGEQTTINQDGLRPVMRLANPGTATAWRRGMLSFQQEPLRYVLDDVNRYAAKPIVAEDDSIREILVTGTLMSDNVEEWIGSLESAFNLKAVEEPKRILLIHVDR
jgi:transmembrane sensor